MRALNLLLAIGAVAVLSTPVRTQQPTGRGTLTPFRSAARAAAAKTGPALVQGNALTATNSPLPNALVRIRDARNGGIRMEQRTDKSGAFVFQPLEPGMYVVELKGELGAVLAASELVAVGAGDTATTIVQLPAGTAAAALRSYRTSSILAVLSSAGAAGVLTAAPTTDVSTETPHHP